jgi:hypothetical protein
VLLPEFRDSQEGTVHFHYLLDGPDALLHAARSLDQHADDLAAGLEGRSADAERSARFVRSFVRPGPIETPATTRFVDALEAIVRAPAPAPQPAPAWLSLIRPFLARHAWAAAERSEGIRDDLRKKKKAELELHRARKAEARKRTG